MWFFLSLDKMHHIFLVEFKSINWVPSKERNHQCVYAIKFKFVKDNCRFYLNEIFEFTSLCRINTKDSFESLSALSLELTRDRKPCIRPCLLKNLNQPE